MGMTATTRRASVHRDELAAIFRHGAGYAERMPMLPAALERIALACAEELASLSPLRPKVSYLGLDSGRVAELTDSEGGARLVGMLHAPAWDAHLLVSFDRDLVYTYVDLVFGGDGTQAPYTEPRPLSRIERRIAQSFLARLAGTIALAFNPFAPTSFVPDGELGRIDPDRLGGPNAPVATARYRLQAGQGRGEFKIAIPDAVLTALKPAFARPPQGNSGASDPSWTQQIHNEINRTRLTMRAVLEERQRPLADIAELRAGQILPLDATPRSPIRVDCNGEPLLWCEMGQSNGSYTLRVHGFVDREQEFMNDILSG